ncbi:hypothetical protein CVT24_002962 [Panaeolus cyanescens]|uniref:Uncharacterized protein n=1 Tax=Panaeolus cyanescens TaxID=181874 RepID=A0A409VPG7_9AGAR|nr:hypothetical protein CVT24_002962 [Panaeolus cyanescens]
MRMLLLTRPSTLIYPSIPTAPPSSLQIYPSPAFELTDTNSELKPSPMDLNWHERFGYGTTSDSSTSRPAGSREIWTKPVYVTPLERGQEFTLALVQPRKSWSHWRFLCVLPFDIGPASIVDQRSTYKASAGIPAIASFGQ